MTIIILIKALAVLSAFYGILYWNFTSDPDLPLIDFLHIKQKILHTLQNRNKKDLSGLPQKKLVELDNDLLIIVSDWVDDGNLKLICGTVFKSEYDKFLLTGFKIDEEFKLRAGIYQVQHCSSGMTHLEYLKTRFKTDYIENECRIDKNLKNIAMIRAI